MDFVKLLPLLAIVLVSACTQQTGGGTGASVTLISPRGGETFNGGDTVAIRYDSIGVDHYQIWFTNNPDFACDSAGWTIVKNHPYYPKSFEYTLPFQETTTARIRVEGHSPVHASLTFECSDFFTINA